MTTKRRWIGSLVAVALVVLFFNSIFRNFSRPVGEEYIDTFHLYLILKHYIVVFSHHDWKNLPTLPMFYGLQNSLFFTDHYFLPGLAAVALYPLFQSVPMVTNALILVTIFAVFFSMFFLARYITQSSLASILAASIYTFNPYITNHIPNALFLFSIEWIPFIFLFFERSLKHPTGKNIFLFFLALAFQVLGSSLYYSAFLTVVLPIYGAIRIRQERISLRRFWTGGAAVGACVFLGVAAIDGYFYLRVFLKESINRPLYITEYFYSAWASSWLFTDSINRLYGHLKNEAIMAAPGLFPEGRNLEQSLFWGVIPFALFLASFHLVRNSKYRNRWVASMATLSVSLLLSFGPRIHLTRAISFPGPFLLAYVVDPLLHGTRVPARFAVFVFFFLALIVAMTVDEALRRIPKRVTPWMFWGIIPLTIFEYWNRPIAFADTPQEIVQFYRVLDSQKQLNMIIEFPLASRFAFQVDETRGARDARYLLYASTLHSKMLFNGFSSFIPVEYKQRVDSLAVGFPTADKLEMLKDWGVGGIVLHKDGYRSTDLYETTSRRLIALGVPRLYASDGMSLFDLTTWNGASEVQEGSFGQTDLD